MAYCRTMVAFAVLAALLVLPSGALRQIGSIALPGVRGRIDHMALDSARQRLFVAALESGTVEVVDLSARRVTRTLRGLREPQGVGWLAAPPRCFVASGGNGTVAVLDGDSLSLIRSVELGSDADNVRVDETAGRVYIGHGEGAIAVLGAARGESLLTIALPAHPEAFALDSSRVYVNVPEAGEVLAADRASGRILARWKPGHGKENFPIAIDPVGRRLFVGCRRPARLTVMSTEGGAAVGETPIDGDVDDLWFDARTARVLASCGAGFVDVIDVAGDAPRVASRAPTAPGARTSLFDPERRRLYVAAPAHGDRPAWILTFEVGS